MHLVSSSTPVEGHNERLLAMLAKFLRCGIVILQVDDFMQQLKLFH